MWWYIEPSEGADKGNSEAESARGTWPVGIKLEEGCVGYSGRGGNAGCGVGRDAGKGPDWACGCAELDMAARIWGGGAMPE